MVGKISIEDEPPDIEAWFDVCRQRLYDKWANTTGHRGDRATGWACEIYHNCRTCDEHLSLPCSLSGEANEIAAFLRFESFAGQPVMFFRLYTVLLSEFCNGLRDAARKLEIKLIDPPKNVSVWCNKFAKHRMAIRIQHHPAYLFADASGDAWPEFHAVLHKKRFIDRCGKQRPINYIDYKWLANDALGKDEDAANDERQAIIVVPPMMELLDSTINYFRLFVDSCLNQPELVKRFESQHFNRACM